MLVGDYNYEQITEVAATVEERGETYYTRTGDGTAGNEYAYHISYDQPGGETYYRRLTLIDEVDLPIDFSVGIPGVNLAVDATIEVTMDYLMGLGLGIGNLSETTFDPGVFMDTSGINTAGEEIALDVEAKLSDNSQVNGTLGFLLMDITNASTFNGEDTNITNGGYTGISGHLGIDLYDKSGDSRLTIADLSAGDLDVILNAKAKAEANLYGQVATSVGDILPSINLVLEYAQELNASLSLLEGSSFEIGDPTLILHNVTLDVGSVFDSFLGEAFDVISEIVTPLKPLVDLLTMEIDLGITTLQFIDIAYLKLPASVVDTAKKVLNALDATIEFLASVDEMSGGINFGTFNLTGGALSGRNQQVDDSSAQ